MSSRKRGLGRGLDALLGVDTSAALDAAPHEFDGELRALPIEWLQPGKYQPRTGMDPARLNELAESIKAQGVVQPIVVRPLATRDRFEIIAGERRWRAAQQAGLREIPALVRRIPDQAAIAMALIENIQREDLHPLEEAQALERLIDEFELTHAQAAEAVGRSRAAVSNLLRLRELHPDVKTLINERRIEMGHARALLGLSGIAQVSAAREVVNKGLNVRQTEALVRARLSEPSKPAAAPRQHPDVARLVNDLSEKLAARVELNDRRGKGKLIIHYASLDELDGILARIR